MEKFSVREEIIEVINKLFVYTDMRAWRKLRDEVFSEKVFFDMSSIGGEKSEMISKAICETWEKEFEGIDAINHLAGNYLIEIDDVTATVFAYATATHYKESAAKGKVREFVGTYNIALTRVAKGWRINKFRYNLKYANGNVDLI